MKARYAAVLTLQKVLARELPCALDTAMQLVPVDLAEEALRKALCQGVCRWYFTLQQWVNMLVDKPLKNKDHDLYCLLLIGLYQLYWMRTPDYACVQATTQTAIALQKSWAKGFINAVMRKAQQQINNKPPQILRKPRSAWPSWLVSEIEIAWPEQAETIFEAGQTPGPMTLRVNLLRHSREQYHQLLTAAGFSAETTAFASTGLRLTEPCNVEQLPGFSLGYCSIQDEAAQLAAELLSAQPGQRVLDACAAPGGKANHILELCPSICELIALEKSSSRLALLHQNHQRLGFITAAQYRHADATEVSSWWDGQAFDRILLDAPCSASGIVRRHPDIRILRHADDIAALAASQLLLLTALWDCLDLGGALLYATCSILPAENNNVISQFLQQTLNAQHVPIQTDWGIPLEYGRQLLPSIGGADGFYYALLRKIPIANATVI